MNKFDLQKRTKQFHLDIIKLCESYPKRMQAMKRSGN